MHLKHDPADRDHLTDRRHLAGPARSYFHFVTDKHVQNGGPNENNRVPRDHNDREPGGELAIIWVNPAPVADTERDDAAEKQSFIRNRIENGPELAALFVTARNITIEPVACGGDQKNYNRGVSLPFERVTALDALPVIYRHQNKRRNHENPDDGYLVGGGHG